LADTANSINKASGSESAVKKDEHLGVRGEDIDIKPDIKAQYVYDGTFDISFDDFDAPTASGNGDPGSGRAAFRHLQIEPVPKDDARKYTLYQSPDEISYTPESALREGLGMVSVFTVSLLGSCSWHKNSGPRDQRARQIDKSRIQDAPRCLAPRT